MNLINLTLEFTYKGFKNKKSYYKNKAKNLVGKGVNSTDQWKRRKQLVEYYKKHPKSIRFKNTRSNKTLNNRLKDKHSGKIVVRRINTTNKAIKSVSPNYYRGKYTNKAKKVGLPLIVIPNPIPGTALAGSAIIGAGAAADKIKVNRLANKSPEVKKALKAEKDLKKSIKIDEKIIDLQYRAKKAKTEHKVLKINDKIRKLKKRYGIIG